MKTEKIKVIRKECSEEMNVCEQCCLDGMCLESGINCLAGEYYELADKTIELIKYEFEVDNDVAE